MDERSVSVGRLRRVPLREVWPHEALDFTVWLQDNLEVLNEHLETPLASAEREQAAGAFSVDLVAEDDDGRAVVIENQLERSNHDHLGKLLTYLAAYEASTAIWIVAEPPAEHVKAVVWLNDSSQANVYLLKAEAVRIGDSTQPHCSPSSSGLARKAVTSRPPNKSAASAMSCGGDSGRSSWPAPRGAPGCTRPSARAPAPT